MVNFSATIRRRQLEEMAARHDLSLITSPPRGYIREIRNALEMSSYQLAKRMNISRSTASKLEASEVKGTITLKSLQAAANALDCQLVYAIIPNTSFTDVLIKRARKIAEDELMRSGRTMALEAQSTSLSEQARLLDNRTNELLNKGGRALWTDA
jgi:predicted DNA-binding mobile mystery protein A